MRLSQIKLAGFKSFVDPTVIHTPGRIVGVVGPNGCGKSNIIDALRWVLGESKASALRGKSMQDVIFNGSATRKPVSRASVELVFDNSRGKAAGQWSNYSEISVKRILQRDAESSYFINNVRVRRRDVSDIFLGTGLGGNAYAIIEQGMISRIIEADPEELRTFLEEAAGISKYRERRRETELRLSGTRENLHRVGDVASELRARIERLENQAHIAKLHHELQAALKTTQSLLWLRKKIQAEAARKKLHEEAAALETEMEAETANLRHLETRLIRMRDEHDLAVRRLQEIQGEMYQASAEISRLQQEIDHVRGNRAGLEVRIEAARKDLDALGLQHEEAAKNSRRWQQDISLAGQLHEECRRELERLQADFLEAGEDLKERGRLHEETKLSLASKEHEEKIEQAHLGHTERTIERLFQRREKLIESRRLLSIPDNEKLSMLDAVLAEMEARMTAERNASSELAKRLESAKAARRDAASMLTEEEGHAAGIRARLSALREIQAKLDGGEELAAWFSEKHFDRLPRLWSKVRVLPGWESALESVLGECVNAILFDSKDPPPGEAVFARGGELFPKSPRDSSLTSLLGLVALDEQAFGGALCDWLSSVYTAKDLEEALMLREKLVAGEFLVTQEGHILTKHSIHYCGTDSRLRGVLVRRQEIERLIVASDSAAASLGAARSVLLAGEAEVARLESSHKEKTARIFELEKARHELQLQRIMVSEANAHSMEQAERIEAELKEIEAQLQSEDERKSGIWERVEAIRESIDVSRERLNALRQDLNRAQSRFDEQNRLMQQETAKCREAEFQEKTCAMKIEESARQFEFLSRNMTQGGGALRKMTEELAALNPAVLESRLQLSLSLLKEKEAMLLAARKESETLSMGLREFDRARQTSELKLGPLREKINMVRLKEQEARIGMDQFEAHLKTAGAREDELAGMLEAVPEEKQLQAEISKLNGKIDSLGAVNLAAFEELEEAAGRIKYLDAQLNDLNEAIETLENAIRRMDRETRERLTSTYGEVNRNLAELFHQLFGGGHAKLVLTGEQIMDSGMEIEAQPPGKKNTSLRLLSGGEKALTALSLVFSLFKLNPAPFCLLDEADAPLDDSNTERFCDMVRKMSEHTQFLFISHNKITMEMAQQLIGVTMQEQGASRIVAVDVETASGGIMTN